MTKVQPRDVSPIIALFRNILLGRKWHNPLRFEDYYAARTQPPPNLPEGPHHKLSDNYFCSHDARREVTPPVVLVDHQKRLAASPSADSQGTAKTSIVRTPGKVYNWDQ